MFFLLNQNGHGRALGLGMVCLLVGMSLPGFILAKPIVESIDELGGLLEHLDTARNQMDLFELDRAEAQALIKRFPYLQERQSAWAVEEQWEYDGTHFIRYPYYLYYTMEHGEGFRSNDGWKVFQSEKGWRVTLPDESVYTYYPAATFVENLTREPYFYWKTSDASGVVFYAADQPDILLRLLQLQSYHALFEPRLEVDRSFHWKYLQEEYSNGIRRERIHQMNGNYLEWEYDAHRNNLSVELPLLSIRYKQGVSIYRYYQPDFGYGVTPTNQIWVSQAWLESFPFETTENQWITDLQHDFPHFLRTDLIQQIDNADATGMEQLVYFMINTYRERHQYQPLISNTNLKAAGVAHRSYLNHFWSQNHEPDSLSVEQVRAAGFTGIYAADRARAQGYQGYAREVYSKDRSLLQTLAYWFTDPYNQHKIMDPDARHMGVLYDPTNHYYWVSIGRPVESAPTQTIKLWFTPRNHQAHLPTHFFSGDEVRGYPIVLHSSEPLDGRYVFQFALIDQTGSRLPCSLILPKRGDFILFLPEDPLKTAHTYTFHIRILRESILRYERTLRFSTISLAPIQTWFRSVFSLLHGEG
jgi:hypothetical protein